MGDRGDSLPLSCIQRIVITGHRNILRDLFALTLQFFHDLDSNLVVIAHDSIRKTVLSDHVPDHKSRLFSPVLGVKPDHLIRIIGNSLFLQSLHIALMPFDPLTVICLEKSRDVAPAGVQEMFCHKITASCVIHEDVGLFLHLRIQSLDKNIGDLILVQCFVQTYMSAQQLTFAGFDDQSVNSLADQFLQESCLLLTAVSCIFQDDTVPVIGQYLIDPLDQPRKNIIRNIGSHHCDISGPVDLTEHIRTEGSFSLKRLYVAISCQDPQSLSHGMSAQPVADAELIFGRKFLTWTDLSGKNVCFHFFHQCIIFCFSVFCHKFLSSFVLFFLQTSDVKRTFIFSSVIIL